MKKTTRTDDLSAAAAGRAGARARPGLGPGAGDPERLQAQQASSALFPLLGVAAYRGHTFTPEEDRPGAAPVVLLSYGFWDTHFGGAMIT